MKIERKINCSKFILNLSRLDDSLKDPALLALLSDGWEVFSYIPVEDNGPKVILLLKEGKKDQVNYSKIPIINTIIMFLIFTLLLASQIT